MFLRMSIVKGLISTLVLFAMWYYWLQLSVVSQSEEFPRFIKPLSTQTMSNYQQTQKPHMQRMDNADSKIILHEDIKTQRVMTKKVFDMAQERKNISQSDTSKMMSKNSTSRLNNLTIVKKSSINLTTSEYDLGKMQELPFFMRVLRQELKNELKNVNFPKNKTLQDMTIETAGQPIRAMLLTTWRSGSTFLSEMLSSHSATYFHYEPLSNFGVRQIRYGEVATKAISQLKSALQCQFHKLPDLIHFGAAHIDLHLHNTRVWKHCSHGKNDLCFKPDLLKKSCEIYPFQTIKTVRLRANLTEELLADDKLNLKVVLLVRDPRATMQSRKQREWCPLNLDCFDPKRLCSDLESDFKAAQHLLQRFPDKFRVLRFEDFLENMQNQSQDLIKYFGFQMTESINKYIKKHTEDLNLSNPAPWSTFRNPKTVAHHWKKELDFSEILKIQRDCKMALKLWGYQSFSSIQDLKTLPSDLHLDLNT